MSDANYRIRYKKGDFEVEVQGDKAWVEAKFEELKKDMPVKVSPSATQTSTPPPTDKTLPASIVEFVRAKGNPSEHTDKAVLFAYWLLKKKSMTSYNSTDIQNCYDEARMPKPANVIDVMNSLQEKGFAVMTDKKDGKKAWVITGTGEDYVQQMKA